MVHHCQPLIKGDKCGDPKCFHDERRVVEETEYIINNGGSASTGQKPAVQCEIDWPYPHDGRTLYLCENLE